MGGRAAYVVQAQGRGLRHALAQLLRFGWLEARARAFAVVLFAGLAVSNWVTAYRATPTAVVAALV
jgi:uncharacterized membrane protein YoaT (DUF817 family)